MSHPVRSQLAPLYRSALPRPMNAAEILREHQDGEARVLAEADADVLLTMPDGSAVHVAHDGTSGSLLPKFPAAQPGEALPFYRHRIQAPMRTWVRFAFSDLVTFPGEEAMALQMAREFATKEVARALTYIETRQLAAAVRDVITSRWLEAAVRREDKQRQEEWLADHQEGCEP